MKESAWRERISRRVRLLREKIETRTLTCPENFHQIQKNFDIEF
jgi:hypothetical protein